MPSELRQPGSTRGFTKAASCSWKSRSRQTASTKLRRACSYSRSGSIQEVWHFASLAAFSM